MLAGSYLNLERQWQKGDSVEMVFDMSFHYWAGEREDYGRLDLPGSHTARFRSLLQHDGGPLPSRNWIRTT